MIRRFLEFLVRALNLPERVIPRDYGRPGRAYLRRYYLFGESGALVKYFPPGSNAPRWWQRPLTWLPLVYIHKFESSDEDRELHSHPWAATSLILAGGYVEERRRFTCEGFQNRYVVDSREVKPGNVVRLGPDTFHRVTLREKDCWTVIVVGELVKKWGFWHPVTGDFQTSKEHIAAKERAAQEVDDFAESSSRITSPGGSS